MTTGAFDAVVAGAGPAGSATAILLARAGWSVAIVEKQRFPRRKVCGECIAASNLPLLNALGLGAAVRDLAGPDIRQVGLLHADRMLIADMPRADGADFAWGRALGRETLDTLLLARARRAGVHVLQPWSVDDIEGEPGRWRCQVRDLESGERRSLQATVMVDAHGSWESLRCHQTKLPRLPSPADLFAFKANFTGASLPPGLLPILAFTDGYGGMVAGPGGVTTLACCVRRDRLDALRRASPGMRAGDAVEQYLRHECQGVQSALGTGTRDGAWLACGPLRPGIRAQRTGQPFMVGNAVGEAHPIIGEGMSMALQSAFLLSACLLRYRAASEEGTPCWQQQAGRSYHAQWRRQFAPRLRLAAAFAQVAMRPLPARLLTMFGQHVPGLLSWGAASAGKVRCALDAASISAWAAFEPIGPDAAPAQPDRLGKPMSTTAFSAQRNPA